MATLLLVARWADEIAHLMHQRRGGNWRLAIERIGAAASTPLTRGSVGGSIAVLEADLARMRARLGHGFDRIDRRWVDFSRMVHARQDQKLAERASRREASRRHLPKGG